MTCLGYWVRVVSRGRFTVWAVSLLSSKALLSAIPRRSQAPNAAMTPPMMNGIRQPNDSIWSCVSTVDNTAPSDDPSNRAKPIEM